MGQIAKLHNLRHIKTANQRLERDPVIAQLRYQEAVGLKEEVQMAVVGELHLIPQSL